MKQWIRSRDDCPRYCMNKAGRDDPWIVLPATCRCRGGVDERSGWRGATRRLKQRERAACNQGSRRQGRRSDVVLGGICRPLSETVLATVAESVWNEQPASEAQHRLTAASLPGRRCGWPARPPSARLHVGERRAGGAFPVSSGHSSGRATTARRLDSIADVSLGRCHPVGPASSPKHPGRQPPGKNPRFVARGCESLVLRMYSRGRHLGPG